MHTIAKIKNLVKQDRICTFVKIDRRQVRAGHYLTNFARTEQQSLVRFADSNGESFQKEQQKSLATGNQLKYMFKFIYMTVRVYGVPWKCRSLHLLSDILRMIGTPSKLHELKDIMLFSHQDYIWGVIKHDVLSLVIDRIKLGSTNGSDNLVYVHYEKIGRICLFCGVMFHIVGNCFMRQGLVTHRMKAKESA
jgi:hypothetical protein